MFVVKQIVWAKVKNYPWWPAQVKNDIKKINKLPTADHNYFKVTFVGQTNHALLEQKAVRKYLEHYEHLKANTYKGLQNSIDAANNELQKRKAQIEESQSKQKTSNNCDKGKKIKKNNKSIRRKLKVQQKFSKNCKKVKDNIENESEQKQEQKGELKDDVIQNQSEKPACNQDAKEKSDIESVYLSQDCERQQAESNQIQLTRSVDRKKIEHTQQVLFSFITRFNSNIFDKQKDCLEAILKIETEDFKSQQLVQSKITNMITYLYKKLNERNSSTLKKQELQKINKIQHHLVEKAYNYLFDCSYYDQFIKRMEKNVSQSHIQKQQKKKNQPRIPNKKYRKYKRKNNVNKKIQHA